MSTRSSDQSNKDKAQHGANNTSSLSQLLQNALIKKYLREVIENYRAGRIDYDPHQFFAPFYITLSDNSSVLLYTTTSLRSDRVKQPQWDALNLKAINPHISSAYLVYADGINADERKKFKEFNQEIKNKIKYSSLDGALSQTELERLLEERFLADSSIGGARAIKGRNFENILVETLKNPTNLQMWKEEKSLHVGYYYPLFFMVVTHLCLDPSQVTAITATADQEKIGLLPSGGLPKTDVIMTVRKTNDAIETYTFSCKRSKSNSVSVHQYSADSFAEILDPNNDFLRDLLNLFQAKGNMKDMGTENVVALTRELQPYLKKLTAWAIGGYNGYGDPETQWAHHVIVLDEATETYGIHTTEDYCENLLNERPKSFGTPFS